MAKGKCTEQQLENLKKGMGYFTKENARELGAKGNAVKRANAPRRKSMAQIADLMLKSELSGKNREQIQKNYDALEDNDLTVQSAVIAGQVTSAMKGNPTAFSNLMELSDRANSGHTDDKPYEIPARVVGKAFVDINRLIEPNLDYIFKGGRGGLKSSYISLKIPELIKNNPNMHACIVRKVAGTLKDSVYAQMKWSIHELGLDDEFDFKTSPLEIRYRKTGQTIYFRGCDDPVKLKSIKPAFGYIGILWIEERDQLNGAEEERSVKQSVLRGGDASYFFASYNPPKSRQSWVNQEELIANPNRFIHSSNYTEAPKEWLGQKFWDDAEHLKEINPDAYEHEYLGIANGDGGNVFEYLELRTITDEEMSHFDTIYQGVDWGYYPDYYAFVRIAYDVAQNKVYILDEHCVNKQTNIQTAEWINKKGYTDTYITCDSAEPKSVADYKDMGIPARSAVKGAGSVDYGFKFLQGRTIVIDQERTPFAFKEFTGYEYERDKDGNVISGYPDHDNHVLDATRYALERFYNKRGNNA